MANNPYVNKVEYAGQTLVDLTNDTATPSDVLAGETFHDRSGTPQTGSLITHNVYDGLDSTSESDALSAKQGKVLNDNISSHFGQTLGSSDVPITNLDNIPLSTTGWVYLGSSIHPSGVKGRLVYICLGTNTYRIIMAFSYITGNTWINSKNNNSWNGWKSFTIT